MYWDAKRANKELAELLGECDRKAMEYISKGIKRMKEERKREERNAKKKI